MKEEKTHWKRLINPDYLGVYSLPDGKDMIVKIISVSREMVTSTNGKKEECTVAKIEGQKPLILNRTNCKTIARMYESPYIEDWAGKTIQLYGTTTKMAGDVVECLRIRPVSPQFKLPELEIGSEAFEKVKKALESGNYTINDIRKKYTVSEETQIALNA